VVPVSQPTDQPAAPAAPPPEVEVALPVPFTAEEAARYAAAPTPDSRSSAPTSYEDCQRLKGHGGPDGSRMYYPSGKLGKLLGEKRICEICGRTGL
jgi:hypothetical protein